MSRLPPFRKRREPVLQQRAEPHLDDALRSEPRLGGFGDDPAAGAVPDELPPPAEPHEAFDAVPVLTDIVTPEVPRAPAATHEPALRPPPRPVPGQRARDTAPPFSDRIRRPIDALRQPAAPTQDPAPLRETIVRREVPRQRVVPRQESLQPGGHDTRLHHPDPVPTAIQPEPEYVIAPKSLSTGIATSPPASPLDPINAAPAPVRPTMPEPAAAPAPVTAPPSIREPVGPSAAPQVVPQPPASATPADFVPFPDMPDNEAAVAGDDIDEALVDAITDRILSVLEPQLADLVHDAVRAALATARNTR